MFGNKSLKKSAPKQGWIPCKRCLDMKDYSELFYHVSHPRSLYCEACILVRYPK